jgi:inosose dehydratase
MLNVNIGHTALTWNVLQDPRRLVDAIRDVADLGFAATETGGFVYDWWERERPGELRRVLGEYGIPMLTLFQFGDWTEPGTEQTLVETADRWSTAVKELGGEMLMLVPGGRREDPAYGLDDFKRMAHTMNRVGETARANGVKTSMHPHWGTVAESRLEIELLLSLLDANLVGFAPDTGQIAKGGADPVPIVERWAGMVRYVHMKDLSPEWERMRREGVPLRSPEGYTEMGQGIIDFRRLLPILDEVNYSGWLMAELDEAKRPPREAATLSKQYIEHTLGLALRQPAAPASSAA